jgi:4-alpha-glucanotransferase
MRSTTCEPARQRRAGVVLHPTSLPGPYGIGDLGPSARAFADFLGSAGQTVWQVLPLGPTGYGDSPYQGLSAFAGNPLLVSPDDLREEGWIGKDDLADAPKLDPKEVDYVGVSRWKGELLRKAAAQFAQRASGAAKAQLEEFRAREAAWLEDFALFSALKKANRGRSWVMWDEAYARREPMALDVARREHAAEIDAQVFTQWIFDRQWMALRAYAAKHGIQLMGDVPIYVAHDSADVWAHRRRFKLDAAGYPAAMAGVPPDYFSATGQLWGNPIHDWAAQAAEGHAFWVERMRQNMRLYDLVRVDHFRGFEAFWEIPGGALTAQNGRWVEGPGASVFEAMQAKLGHLPIVAENLGVITPAVEALRHKFGWPGMAILQFAFGDDEQAHTFLPHNYERDLVAYTGTHDNDTVMGWWASKAGVGSTRTQEQIERERAKAKAYLNTDGREMNWVMLRALYGSAADMAIAPMQDLLGLGTEARMNVPGTSGGNWRWRLQEKALTPKLAARARELVEIYERSPGSVSSNQKKP